MWIETASEATWVENKIDMRRRLTARADANASVRPPGGPDTSADGSGGSQLDEGTMKDQGKVYRVDAYVVHWQADGDGPLQVRLSVSGAIAWQADWLPKSGSVRLVKTLLLEPPAYSAPAGATGTRALLEVVDCCGAGASMTQRASIA